MYARWWSTPVKFLLLPYTYVTHIPTPAFSFFTFVIPIIYFARRTFNGLRFPSIFNKIPRLWFYKSNVNDYLMKKGLCHVKDSVTIYHLTESLCKMVYFSVTSILLKQWDKMCLALDCAHHMIMNWSCVGVHIRISIKIIYILDK